MIDICRTIFFVNLSMNWEVCSGTIGAYIFGGARGIPEEMM